MGNFLFRNEFQKLRRVNFPQDNSLRPLRHCQKTDIYPRHMKQRHRIHDCISSVI